MHLGRRNADRPPGDERFECALAVTASVPSGTLVADEPNGSRNGMLSATPDPPALLGVVHR
jgi:hypothetical protein